MCFLQPFVLPFGEVVDKTVGDSKRVLKVIPGYCRDSKGWLDQ